MKIDIKNGSVISENSIYLSSFTDIPSGKLMILGADQVIHDLLKERIENSKDFSMDPENISSLYKEIPAQYVIILFEKDLVKAVSDPYGIIKLYYFRGVDKFYLVDSLSEIEDETLYLNKQALKYYFITGYTPSKHTYFENVEKVEPFTINIFSQYGDHESENYPNFGADRLSVNSFLSNFQTALTKVLYFIKNNYKSSEVALTGGIDSTFLLMLMNSNKMTDETELSAFKMGGLGQDKMIDNDYDLSFAAQLAEIFSKELSIIDYDFKGDNVSKDFDLLRDALGCDYCPGMGYVGYCRSIDDNVAIINGQNADSILSFGGMGWPKLKWLKPSGLHGLFTRYFQFYGEEHKDNLLGFIARLLRKIYFIKNFPSQEVVFNRKNYFKGLGLNPENRSYFPSDPAYQNIEDPDDVANWFEAEYIDPVLSENKDLSDHALSIIIYNKTYMQGSANRGSILSALMYKKPVFLPYTSLEILEMMTTLKPFWGYAFYGKYPNVRLGKKELSIPKYILDRQDPNDADSSTLLFTALTKNKKFNNLISDVLNRSNFDRYEGILRKSFISQIKDQSDSFQPSQLSTLMRFVWVESILQKHKLD
ncbi:hypothetical protein OAK61_01695 [Gammaproteobacteria bacterium]|nr:hypothetical protein [Gammaproteobacteria bacterium]